MGRRRDRNKKGKLSQLWVLCTFMLLLSVVFSLLAHLNWVFDLFSHFVIQYIIVSAALAILLLLFKRKGWALVAVLIMGSQVYKVKPYFGINEVTDSPYDEVKILQYNVNRNNKNVEQMARWIVSKSEDIDIVVLLEVNERWQESIRRIKWAYPYHISKDMRGGRNMVVFSRLYVDEIEIKQFGENKSPAIVIRGETTGYEQDFVLYGAHPPPPILPSYAKANGVILDSIARHIAKEKIDHKMLVADFNRTRFSPHFKDMIDKSELNDSNEGFGFEALQPSWPSFLPNLMGITIDNVLVSDNIIVDNRELGPAMGSDHYPVITTLKLVVPDENNS